jgi:hypothetical protein
MLKTLASSALVLTLTACPGGDDGGSPAGDSTSTGADPDTSTGVITTINDSTGIDPTFDPSTTSSTDPTLDPDSSSGGSTGPGAECGNDMVEMGEDCDGTDLDGADCASQGFDRGTLACDARCEFDTSMCEGGGGMVMCNDAAIMMGECPEADTAACVCQACDPGMGCGIEEDCVCPDCIDDGFCSDPGNCTDDGLCDPYLEGCQCADCAGHASCPPPAVCGDGMVGPGEACDGMDLGGVDCDALGFDGGTLACDAVTCQLDTSMCVAPPLMCDDVEADASCVDADAASCTCQACDMGGGCEASEDCVCPDCAMDAFCAAPCAPDGVCDPYNEGCNCVDCLNHPLCAP